MSKIIEKTTRVAALALALAFGLATTGWAANAPTATVSGTSVTISNESGAESWDNAAISDMSGYQGKNFTIPAIGTDLPSGTILKITSVSVAKSTSQTYMPDKLGLSGCVSAYRTISTGGFTSAAADKYTYSFADTDCLVKVGTATPIRFFQNSGAEHNSSIAFRLGANAYQFIASIVWGGKVPIIEIQAEIVSGFVNSTSGSGQSDWGFESGSGSGKVYLSGYGNYLKTPGSNEKEIVLVDGTYGYGLKVINGNSTTASGNVNGTVFTKLSGTGTLTTDHNENSGVKSVIQIYDSSDFSGAIQTGFSGGPKASVVFRNSGEILPDTLYNLVVATTPAQIYVSAGKTGANAITIPAGKTWRASCLSNCGETIINGTFSGPIVNSGTLTINGEVTGSIANSGSGTVTVNAGATLSSVGTVRDFTGWTVDSTVAVPVTMTSEEYGKGSINVSGATGVHSIAVYAPDGTTSVGTITPDSNGDGTLATGVKVSGLATWCDYEFNGNRNNSGVDTTGLNADISNLSSTDEFYNNTMLYTYTHPWRNISYPDSWTAVVRCTVPNLENAAVIMFGTYGAGAIGLIAGPNPETDMLLVSTPGSSATTSEAKHFTTLQTMSVQNATSAQHVYVFTKSGTTVNVYCDGDHVLTDYNLSSAVLGGGLQIGSLHGGVVYNNVSTGIVRFGKDELDENVISVDEQMKARIDCVRMYDYVVSADQISELSTEFPAVKLYRATVANGANTDWNSLSWTPNWDGGNEYSKIILTVEGDASLTLPASITAEDFEINVASGKKLTISLPQGGSALQFGNPIEINGGSAEFNASPAAFDFGVGGTGSVYIDAANTVVVLPGGSLTKVEGAGTITYAYYGNTLPGALTFGDWTGTVVLPGFVANGVNFNDYGKSGSTVALTGITSGWLGETSAGNASVAPTLRLDGNVTLTGFSTSWAYTFAEITGTGNLSFAPADNHPGSLTITKVAEGYSGTISNTSDKNLAIGTLDRADGTTVTAGSKVLSTSSNVSASALTVAGAATGIIPVFDTDGLYVKAASVTKNDATTNYDTLSAATTALGSDAGTLTLLMSTDSAITLAPGQTLVNGNLTTGSVTGPNGYELVNNNGTYTLVDNTASTWAPGDGSDNSWNTGANWSTGYKPNAYTAVTFPSGTHTVSITGHSDSAEETAKCASMQLVGDVTFQRGGSDWTYLLLGGNITGSGTMTLARTGIKVASNSSVSIGCPVVGNAASNDNFFAGSGATYTFSSAVTVAAGEFKAEYTHLVFNGLVTICDGAYVKANGAGSTATFNGGIAVPENAAARLTVDSGTHTIASTVTLASGATLTVPTAATTVTGATFATSVADSYVKSTAGESTTVYSVAAKTVVTVSVGSNVSLAINGNAVADGDTLKFTPGDTFTYAATPAANYTATVTVTGGTDNNGTVTVGETAITVAATAARNGITVSNVAFEYGANYATADVTATVSDPSATYTLTVGQNSYNGSVSGTTVTFSNVATGHASAYDSVSYTITATDGEAAVPVTSGGSGSAVVADSDKWVDENSGTTRTAAAGGSWATEVAYDNDVAVVSDNTFTAVNCSTGDLVTVTIENVVYEALSDLDVSAVAADSQGAFCLGAVEANDVVTTNFMILAKEDSAFVWKPAAWSGTPALNTEYDVEFSFDYAHGKYSVKINGTALSVNNATAFDLCTSKTEVKAVDFKGGGKLSSILGVESTGYMVKDSAGNWYATIADAIAAYDAANGPYFVLHAGTPPAGWKIVTADGVSILKKDVSGVMILAY